jgi:hypothetical protein
MKPILTPGSPLDYFLYSLTALSSIAFCESANAQSPISVVFTHRANATTLKTYAGTGATGLASSGFASTNYIYQFGTNVSATSNILLLDSFTSIGMNFRRQTATLVTKFCRANNTSVTGARRSLWFEQSSSVQVTTTVPAKLLPDYDDSLERIFSKGNILNIGMDNNFQNATTTNNNNIERVDYIIPSGVKATDVTRAGFAVFDRGSGTSHDPFYIAAIKTLDASGNPASYYNAVAVASTNYGNNVVSAINYLILRKNPTETSLLLMNNSVSQNLDGVLLKFSNLGVANNAVIYGYSLFGPDVTVSPAANMVDYTNATNFPTASDLSSGGLDQVAISGLWVTDASYVVLAERIDNLSAQWADDKVTLTWTLEMADGVNKLVVERSPDGKDYTPLSVINTPSTGKQCTTDDHPLPGLNYYRLRLLNEDEVIAYSPVACITTGKVTLNPSMNVYPNPVADGRLTISGEGLSNDTYDIRVFNLSGHVVAREKLPGGPAFIKDLALPEGLPRGAYTILLTDSRGNRIFTKVIMLR